MQTRNRTTGVLGLLLAAFALPVLGAGAGTAFTYQGRLIDNGAPANGFYDIECRLYDAVSGGNAMSAPLDSNDVNVANGLFTIPLDFGSTYNGLPIWNGTALWLDIGIRPGASNGAFTPLTPRQALTGAPLALYALNDAHWHSTGTAISNSNTGFVGIGRSSPVTGSDVFAVKSPVSSGYAGMYLDTSGVNTRPFYGYALNGAATAWTELDGTTNNWYVYNNGVRLTVGNNGFVGIGRTTPVSGFDVFTVKAPTTNNFGGMYMDTGGATARPFYGYALNGVAAAYTELDGNTGNWNVNNNGTRLTIGSSGFVGIGRTSPSGSAEIFGVQSPASGTNYGGMYMHTANTAKPFYGYDVGNWSAWTYLDGTTHDWRVYNNGDHITVTSAGNVGIGTNTPAQLLDVNGTARVKVLEIVGADVAEKFPVSGCDELQPGTVMMIDADHPGHLCRAAGAYNQRVAGVISGANGLPAGTVLGHLPGNEDAPPIALSGRVWVQCDASSGAIAAGDLLTTADLPGYAMRAEDSERTRGAVLGKAMTSLASGQRGLVLVLVNLQ